MDLITIIGMVLGIVMLVGGFLYEGGTISALFALGSVMFVIGGTLAATIAGSPASLLRQMPRFLGEVLREPGRLPPEEIIPAFARLAKIARSDGLIALQSHMDAIPDPFFHRGLLLLLDGAEENLVVEVLSAEVEAIESRYRQAIRWWEMAGGYAPTFGIVGTSLTMITILGNLGTSSSGELGHQIAVAFTATVYGLVFANLICFPLAEKLKQRAQQAVLHAQLIATGLLALRRGSSPAIVEQQLSALLDPDRRPAQEGE